jgi:hypothetical protein
MYRLLSRFIAVFSPLLRMYVHSPFLRLTIFLPFVVPLFLRFQPRHSPCHEDDAVFLDFVLPSSQPIYAVFFTHSFTVLQMDEGGDEVFYQPSWD